MTPIYGLSDQVRLPRLGKIRLGIKKKTKGGVEYPCATEYFIVPSEIVPYLEKLGVDNPGQPTALPVQIPVEDDDIWASQYYKCYSGSRGLTCKGDGKTCNRMIDVNTGLKAGKDAVSVTWKNEVCAGQECQYVKDRQCKPTLNLQFIMPDVPGLGVWQIDSHFMSIRNINSDALLLRKVYGRISFIPLYLTLEPEETVTEGKKKTVRTLHLRIRGTMREALLEASKSVTQMLLPPPDEKEEPIDDDIIEGELTESDENLVTSEPAKVAASAAESSGAAPGVTDPPPDTAKSADAQNSGKSEGAPEISLKDQFIAAAKEKGYRFDTEVGIKVVRTWLADHRCPMEFQEATEEKQKSLIAEMQEQALPF